MKRLTKTYEDGTYGVADDLPCGENSWAFKQMLIDRLGSFEDPKGTNGRCIEDDVKVLDEFISKGGSIMTLIELKAAVSLQLEIYKRLNKPSTVVNNNNSYYETLMDDDMNKIHQKLGGL